MINLYTSFLKSYPISDKSFIFLDVSDETSLTFAIVLTSFVWVLKTDMRPKQNKNYGIFIFYSGVII